MYHGNSQIGFCGHTQGLWFCEHSVYVVYWLSEYQINSSNANLQDQNMDFTNIHLTLMCLQSTVSVMQVQRSNPIQVETMREVKRQWRKEYVILLLLANGMERQQSQMKCKKEDDVDRKAIILFEIFTVNTKLAEVAVLASNDLTTAKKKLPPMRLDRIHQIITGLETSNNKTSNHLLQLVKPHRR